MLRLRDSSTSSSEAERPAASPRVGAGGAARAFTPLLSFVLTIAVLVGWGWHHRDALQADIKQHGVTEGGVLAALDHWRSARSPGRPPAVLFGDSLITCRDGATVGQLVARHLADAGTPHDLVEVANGAFSPLQYYELLDDVLAAAPRLAIVEIDLGRLSGAAVAPSLRYASLARKLSLRRAWRVRAALELDGLTLFDPFLYRLEERFDTMYLVPGAQAAWHDVIDRGGSAVARRLGLATVSPDARSLRVLTKWDTDSARNLFRASQIDHPLAAVLRQMAAELRAAHVRMIFFVSPVNPDVLREATPEDKRRFPARMEALRAAIGVAPEEWLDLHGLVLRDVFHDQVGHMVPAGCEAVADRLRDALVGRAGRRDAAAQAPGAADHWT